MGAAVENVNMGKQPLSIPIQTVQSCIITNFYKKWDYVNGMATIKKLNAPYSPLLLWLKNYTICKCLYWTYENIL